MLRHDPGAPAENAPRKKRTDKSVAQTDPSGGKTEIPAELPRITYENDRGKIRRAEREGTEPRSDRTGTEHETVYIGGVPAGLKTDTEHEREKENAQTQGDHHCTCHNNTSGMQKKNYFINLTY